MRHVSVQQLSAFVDHALSGVSRELVIRHLAACTSCRKKHAAWQDADEALRHALAWTPNERTLEEWSSRVELCITAERKGLPVPEFTPTLLPVIAAATPTALPRMRELLEGARGSMLSNARDRKAAKRAEARAKAGTSGSPVPVEEVGASEFATTPQDVSDPAPEPAHHTAAENAEPETRPEPEIEHAVEAVVASPPEPVSVAEPELPTEPEPVFVAEPESPAEPEAEPAAEPELATEPESVSVAELDPEPMSVFSLELQSPSDYWTRPQGESAYGAEPVAAHVPEPESRPARPAKRDPFLELKPLPELSDPIHATAPLDESWRSAPAPTSAPVTAAIASRLERAAVPAPARTTAERPHPRRGLRRLLAACVVLLLVLLASPFMPEVIRIPLPERWRPRLPRVEFVRHGGEPAEDPARAPDAALRLATSQPAVPELVPQGPLPTPVDPIVPTDLGGEATRDLPTGAVTASEPALTPPAASTVAPLPAPEGASARPLPMVHAHKRGNARPATSAPTSTGSDAALVPDNPATVIPVRVSTSVRLSPTPVRKAPEPEHDEEWPLLCGEVIDAAGLPIEGARVQLVSPSLTVRTDRRGRFCIACPPGLRALRVEASGFPVVNRTVELSGGMVETRIALPPAR